MDENERLAVAYTTDDPSEADILCVALREEGIPCEIEGERQAGLVGLPIMQIKLLVRAGDLERARDYLEQHAREQEEENDDRD